MSGKDEGAREHGDTRGKTGDDRVAHVLLEQLQVSGERERLKEWLMEALESSGWVDQTLTLAEQADPPSAPEKSCEQLAHSILPQAANAVPAPVKAALLKQLVAIAKRFEGESGA